MKSWRLALIVAVLLGVCAAQGPTQVDLNNAQNNTSDWLYVGHDYSQQNFVELNQINTNNAHELQPVCMFQLGKTGSFQAKPIVYDGIIYLTLDRLTVALDASSCHERWRYDWQPKAEETGLSQRGVTIKDGMVIRGTKDGYLIALDAVTGELVWERQSRSVEGSRENFSNPPLLYENLLITGPSWPWPPAKGWISAFDITSGDEVWTFNTVPDADESGAESWGDLDALAAGELGGVGIWDISLDAETGTLYVATADPKPDVVFPGEQDNLYAASLLALDVWTGELKWYYQLTPGGQYGWDASQAGPLFETVIDGEKRRLVATGGKDGLLHVLDRDSGELVYAVPVTTQKNVGVAFTPEGTHMCPGHRGSLMWNGPAFSPLTNMIYTPTIDWCTTWYESDDELQAEDAQSGYGDSDPIDDARGWLYATEAATGTLVWRHSFDQPMLAGVTATSGNVVFTGDLAGNFLTFHARNGEELYRFNTGGAIAGGVVSYQLDDKQYVAVMSGHNAASWGASGAATVILFALP